MLDLLLVRPNDQKEVYGTISAHVACELPYWAAVIAAYVQERNGSVEILDAEAENLSTSEAIDCINRKAPKLIGIIVTGTNLSASTWKMHGAGILATLIQKETKYSTFLWGLHPSALPEQTLKEERVDYVIKGEGLESIYQLLQFVNGKNIELGKIKGLFYRSEEGSILGNPEIELCQIENFPEPSWKLLDMKRYQAHNWHRFGEKEDKNRGRGYAVVATTLGCPFQCTFCAVSSLFGKKYVRYLSPQKVVHMIEHLVEEYQVKYIKLLDECFVLNKEHVEAVCDLLIEKQYDLNIWAYARVDTVDEVILKKLYQAGVRWLAYGIESASELSLKEVSKGQYSVEKIKRVMQMTQEAGIHIMANFMFGLPADTMETMQMSLEFAREINPEFINFYCTMAYPGSKLYETCIQTKEKLPETWLGYSQFSYECVPLATKYVSSKEVLRFRDAAFVKFFEMNPKYFKMIEEKFGIQTVLEIQKLLDKKLKRKLLEEGEIYE